MKNYRGAFALALVGNIVLLGAVAGLWWHWRALPRTVTGQMPSTAVLTEPTPSDSSAPAQGTDQAPLLPVQLSPQRLQSIGVTIGDVRRKQITDEIRTTGNVAVDETRVAYVQIRFSGWIKKVFADATYQFVRQGQPLFTIYSPDLVATEREYLLARQNQQQLAQSTIPGVASGGVSLLDAAAERLKQWGVPQSEIERLEASGEVRQELEIDSTVSGYITERDALASKYVQPDTRLYTVVDLSTVWVFAQVFQSDLGRIRIGAPVALTVDSYADRTFTGKVDFIYPDVDVTTRTARVRLVVPNRDMKLSPGMFINAALKIPMGEKLTIPSTGVLQSGTRSIVFVARDGGNLEPRDVELGPRIGDDYVVVKGLSTGERIATSANFLIDSESQLQAALGAFIPPPPGASGAAAANVPSANIQFSTDPNPARKGKNTFRVNLKDATGAAVTGADVGVTFSMPAMPAMGMAAVRITSTLSDKGRGVYEGSGTLPTGGNWDVTITARRGGQVMGVKQLSVSATGGA